MPKLQDLERRETKKITLPSSTPDDEAWVEVYTEALAGDIEALGNAGELRGHASIVAVTNIVKKWNFENADGTMAEVNIENVRRLQPKDLLFILENVDAYNELLKIGVDQKKNTKTISSQK